MTIVKPLASVAAIALAFTAIPATAQSMQHMNHNSIQPETTLNLSATSSVSAAPDIAYLSGGVTTEARTAAEAIRQNAADMAGVYAALERAGLEEANIQTSNFSLNPRYNYPQNSERVLVGYTASNQLRVTVRDMDKVGGVIDAMVAEGGNTFSGVQFGVEDPSELLDEARRDAMRDAMSRANLFADVSGLSVARIVTISENTQSAPSPQPVMMRAAAMEAAPTQISGGELSFSATVNVVFELED
ncbi:SIMPL domain-containing protein [Ponticaulis sp.]|uniref:SIMPL domain-containing protein n=1 Tax=Ponticaulis sp. TaxID=2020902 RepID=UPI000B6AC287|nr:SIMPL domain-containing protein [Ponticaulis sp.]MAJ07626.1 SIMPL domain-containing protein [Ponticaulis sp.]RPG17855.1 MAG: SIMPL domain-containing protein [Hyphomonadaceae bacterium TMED125]HBH88511.1 SIMPL domain-containing protein [Hyphomonadaceae bacterium]|tara:strand:- start:9434 stop:10168 length:735 start_codon:yes stop_codon:yes gene_type:complete